MFSLNWMRSGSFPDLSSLIGKSRTDPASMLPGASIGKGIPALGKPAVVVEVSETAFRNQLEKHIKDYESGKGNLSKRTGGLVAGKHFENGLDLNQIDPQAGSAYSGYSGGFSYGRNARFRAGVHEANVQIKKITSAYEKEEELQQYYSSLAAQIEQSRASEPAPADSTVDITV